MVENDPGPRNHESWPELGEDDMNDSANSDDWVFGMGTILGDSDSASDAWAREIGRLALAARPFHKGISSPLRVNVIFHVDGLVAPNTFVGVRTGSFLRRRTC